MKNKALLIGLIASVAVIGSLLWMTFSDASDEVRNVPRVRPSESKIIATASTGTVATSGRARRTKKGMPALAKSGKKRMIRIASVYSAEDQKLSDEVQTALDADSYSDVLKAATAAMKSDNPEVRSEAVDALGWFGDKALVPLTKAMMDKDGDVADNARGQVETALMGMDDSKAAFDLAASYISTFGGDEEAITMFEGILTTSADQIVEPEDPDSLESVMQARENRTKIVETLMSLMQHGGKLDKAARSAYEQIVGEPWTNVEAAAKWSDDLELPESENQ